MVRTGLEPRGCRMEDADESTGPMAACINKLKKYGPKPAAFVYFRSFHKANSNIAQN